MVKVWTAVAVAVSVWVLAPAPAFSQAPSGLKERLFAEVPQKWQELESFTRNLQGTISEKATDHKGKARAQSHIEVKRHRDCFLVTRAFSYPETFKPFLLAQNSQYAFRLERKAAQTEWVVTDVALNRATGRANELADIPRSAKSWLCTHYMIANKLLPEFIADPAFVFKDGRYLEGGDQGLVRVAFSHRVTDPNQTEWFKDGWMVLDTRHYWCIREYEVHYQNRLISVLRRVKYQYEVSPDGFPVVRRMSFRDTPLPDSPLKEADGAGGEYQMEFDFSIHNGIPEREFTLSAFGFPEPAGVRAGRTRSYVWLAGAAAASAVLALLCRRLARRRSTSS